MSVGGNLWLPFFNVQVKYHGRATIRQVTDVETLRASKALPKYGALAIATLAMVKYVLCMYEWLRGGAVYAKLLAHMRK